MTSKYTYDTDDPTKALLFAIDDWLEYSAATQRRERLLYVAQIVAWETGNTDAVKSWWRGETPPEEEEARLAFFQRTASYLVTAFVH